MRERDLEQKLCLATLKRGGLCLKWVSPGWSGAPDRIVLMPGGKVGFVELKAPGAKPRPLQARRAEQLRRLGFPVSVVDGEEQIAQILDSLLPKEALPEQSLAERRGCHPQTVRILKGDDYNATRSH